PPAAESAAAPSPPEPALAPRRPEPSPFSASAARRERWSAALAAGQLPAAALFDLLRDYGIPAVAARPAGTADDAPAAAAPIGHPVALRPDWLGTPHRPEVGGARLGIAAPAELAAAYADLSARLGPHVTVTEMARPGPELILGMSRDPALGPLIVI